MFLSLLLCSFKTTESIKTHCVHPVFSCFYYEPCDLSSLGKNFNLPGLIKIQKCPKGLVFSEELQKCRWMNAWQTCLKIDLDITLVKDFLIRNFTKAQPKQAIQTLNINVVTAKKQLDAPKSRVSKVDYSSRNLLQEISRYSSYMDKVGDYSFVVIPIKLGQDRQDPDTKPSLVEPLRYKKVCYVTNWSQYREGYGRFQPENIDPFLCTHVIYAFAYIDEESLLLRSIEHNDLGMFSF